METLLGVLVSIVKRTRRKVESFVVKCELDPPKARSWREKILQILHDKVLRPDVAKKLAGRLNFAVCAAVGGPGGARLREIYRHSYCLRAFSASLEEELLWWAEHLLNPRPVYVPIGPRPDRVVILYTDAAGSGGVGGVLSTPDKLLWFRGSLDISKMNLESRKTQIIPLEAAAPLIAVRLLKFEMAASKLVVFIDNQFALGALRKGRSDSNDVHAIVSAFNDILRELSIRPVFRWVPSGLNIADYPSRGISLKTVFPEVFSSSIEVPSRKVLESMYR